MQACFLLLQGVVFCVQLSSPLLGAEENNTMSEEIKYQARCPQGYSATGIYVQQSELHIRTPFREKSSAGPGPKIATRSSR